MLALALFLALDPFGALTDRVTADLAAGRPVVIDVHVPLCDNDVLRCGNAKLGDGDRPEGNLYWATTEGVRRWFDKRWMYEESFLMPLLVRWPGVVKPGTEIKQLTQNIDFAPTFLEAAGCTVPEEVQGVSLVPLLKGEKVEWRDALYYHYYDCPGATGYGVRLLAELARRLAAE